MNSFGDIKKKYDSGNNYNSFEDINTAYNGEPETSVLDNIANTAKSAYDWIDNETRYVDNQLTKAKDAVVSGVSNAADYASDFVSNTAKSVGNWAQDTFQANMDYRDAIERAETAGTIFSNGPEPTQEEVIEKGAKAYDTGIGKPAMYVAMTPYAPKNVKVQAGILALPTIVRDTMHSFDQNSQVAESEGGGFGDAVLNTAKGLVVDPIVEPIKAWYDNPSAQADVIRQGGLGALYDNVLMPFEGIRGAYHAGKAVTPKRVKEGISTRFDDVKSRVNDKFKSFKDINEAYTEPPVTADGFSGIRDTFKSEPSSSFDGTASEWNVDSPTDMRRAVYDRLRSDGFFTDTEAAALTGNIAQENASFKTKAISDDGYGSQGLVQWTDDRLDNLKKFAADNGGDPFDWRTQVDFIKHEMQTSERAALERMRNNPNATPEEMAVIVREAYERPNPAYANDTNRMQQAREVYDGQSSPHNNTARAYDADITNRVADETYNPQTIDFTNEGRMAEKGIVEQPNLNIMEPEVQNQIVYHGTGYKFDAFDNTKANSGAGQQAHGHGTYFATDKAVAKVYRDGVKEKTGEGYLKKVDIPEDETILYEDYPLKNNSKITIDNVKRAIDSLDGDAKSKMVTYLKNKLGYNEYVDGYQELVKKQEFMTKKMANLEDFLNGESVSPLKMKSALKSAEITGDFKDTTVVTKAVESLRKQLDDLSKEREAIEIKGRNANELSPEMIEQKPSLLIDEHLKNTQNSSKVLNGRDIYRGLREALGDDVSASRYLDIHGVDGLSYHDMKEGKNYVIFNPEKARILEQDVQYMRKNPGSGAGVFVEREAKPVSNKTVKLDERVNDTQNFSDNANSPYRYVEGEENISMDRAVTRKEIFSSIDENLKTVRHGRIGKRGVGGFYNRRTDALRVKQYGDFETSAHELGHYVDNHFGFTKNSSSYYPELIDNVRKRFGDGYESLGELGVAKEGFAEFFRDYTTNRARAKTDFPQFYDEFKQALASDAELNKRVENVSGVLHQWYRQNPHERLKGSITFGRDGSIVQDLSKDPRGTVKRFLDDAYTRVVDELHPLQQIVEQVESITGEKLDYNQNPFMQAWTARGWVGKAEVLLEKSENGFISFKDAIKPIPENLHQDFSTYLVAKRQMDILKWNAEHPKDQIYTDKTLHDINATIQYYENGEFGRTFKTAQQNIVQYSNHLLDMAVDAGLITQDSVIAMRQKYPNYVPFIRDFGKAGIENFGNTGGGFMNVKAPIKAMKGSARDIVDPLESIIKNTYSFVRAVERNKVAKSFVDISKIDGMSRLVEEVDGTPSAKDNTFYVMEDGVKKVYQTEPDIYKALEFTNAESSKWIVDVMKTPAGWLRAGATQLSPEFILRNPVRDMIGATIYSKHGFIPLVDTVKGVLHYLKKDKVYWDYLESGAGNSAMVSLDRNYLQNSIRDILKQPSVVKKIVTSPLDVIRGLNEATEMATRLAEFDNARKGHTGIINRLTGGKKKPLSSAEAGIQARDVTLDFSRIGKNTKSVNKTIAFFNASLQGTDKMIRAFKENPAQMTVKTAAFITLPSVALWWLNKDDPRYQELPQWEKDVFWIIPTEDTLIKIPKPFELGILFGTVPERALQFAYDKQKGVNGRGFEGVGATAFDNMMPSLFPTAVIPIIEWAANYSFFMQRDIVPQSMTKLPDHLQSDWRTSFIGNQVGQTFDVSPMKVDNTIRGYGGGFGSLIMDMTDRASGVADTRPAKKWNEQPVIKGFTETPYKSSDSVQRLYDEYNKQDSLLQARKLTGEKQEGFDAKTYNRTKQAYQQLQQLNKAAKKIRESKKLNSEQKREKLDMIDFQKVNAARRGLGLRVISR